jgi:hypothetical protein
MTKKIAKEQLPYAQAGAMKVMTESFSCRTPQTPEEENGVITDSNSRPSRRSGVLSGIIAFHQELREREYDQVAARYTSVSGSID